MKKLRKTDNSCLMGVSGAIGEYIEVDPTLIRIAFVVLAIWTSWPVVLVYIVLGLIIPDSD